MMKIIVLGAGLSGMIAGRELSREHDVTILEKEDHTGGLASSFAIEGQYIPKFYHHVIASNAYTIRELERYGLMKETAWKRISMEIGISGRLYNIRNPLDLIQIPGASLWAKFRFGLFGLYTLFFMNPDTIPDDKAAQEYLYEQCGKEATDFFWWNLYGRNKFNVPLEQLSARQFAYRLYEKEVYEKFTFPPTGIQGMLEGIEKTLKDRRAEIHLNTAIAHIDLKGKKVVLSSGKTFHYDVLINSIPMPEFLKVAYGLPEAYAANLRRIRYCPAVCMCFATRKFLKKGVYWMNLFGERIHIIIQHSVLADKYRDKISWVIRYGGSEEDLNKSEDEIKKLYVQDLEHYFDNMEIVWFKIFRTPYAEPIWDKSYTGYSPGYETPTPSLFMTGVQVMFPKIRDQNTALESGYEVAQRVRSHFP